MHIRIVAAASAMLLVGGCADQAGQAGGPPPSSAAITVDGTTETAQSISCTQVQWLLTIEAVADPARARTMLRLGEFEPTPLTVNLENFDNFNGISGEAVDGVDAEATFADGTYTVTGTARGTDPDNPSTERTAEFRIEARC